MNKKHNRFRSHMPREQLDQLQGTEIKSKRTRFGKVFALGANRFQAVTYTDPVHRFNEKTHEWDEMDNRFSSTPRMKEAKVAWKQGIMPAVSHGDILLECKTGSMDVACAMSGEVPFINLTDAEGRHLAWGIKDAMSILPEADDINDAPALNVRGMREKVLDHLHGEVTYNGIFAGVDLRCKLGRSFKDELIFTEPESVRNVTFLLESEGREMELTDDQVLVVKDAEGKAVFCLQAPFMEDANHQHGDVTVQLEECDNGVYAMTYVPDASFLADAAYPVVLDPALDTTQDESAITDTFVSELQSTNFKNHTELYTFIDNYYGKCHSYLKINNLPEIASNHYITSASLFVRNATALSSSTPLLCSEVTGAWDPDTITFAEQPTRADSYLDYCYFPKKVDSASYLSYVWRELDLTELARRWYNGEANNGVVFTPRNESPNTVRVWSSRGSYPPYFVVNYASLAGLESYLPYDSQAAGLAGNGSVSLVNGNLIFSHHDTVTNGNRMPVSVTHYYNSCDADKNEFGLGYGWRTNMHQTLHMERINGEDMYVYTDGDGTEHWFEQDEDDTTKYVDMSGLSLTLKAVEENVAAEGDAAATVTRIIISSKSNSILKFPVPQTPSDTVAVTARVLISSVHDAHNNAITVTPISAGSLLIKEIRDGAGRPTIFDYDETNTWCTAIHAPWQKEDTSKACARFVYVDGNLDAITHEDGRVSHYVYMLVGNYHLLTSAYGDDGLAVNYQYTNKDRPYGGLPHCVTHAECGEAAILPASDVAKASAEPDSSKLYISNVNYDIANHMTLITDQISQKTLRYHYNDNGNPVSIDDELGFATYAHYDQSGANENAPINHATTRSRMQRAVKNLLADPMFTHNSSLWEKSSSVDVTRDPSVFKWSTVSWRLAASNAGTYLRQAVTLNPGKGYTLSGYLRSSAEKTFLRAIYTVNGEEKHIDSDPVMVEADPAGKPLHRIAVSFELPENAAATVYCAVICVGTSGYGWAANMQLEEGLTCNHFNMLEDQDYMSLSTNTATENGWRVGEHNYSAYLSVRELNENSDGQPAFLGHRALHFEPHLRTGYFSTIEQQLKISGSAGDRFTFGGWCSTFAKKHNPDAGVYCCIDVLFPFVSSSTGETGWVSGGKAEFNFEEGNWQFASGGAVAPHAFSKILLRVNMTGQMNPVDVTGLYLYPEAFGTDYVYDAKGNRTTATHLYGGFSAAEYDECDNLIRYTAPGHTKSSTFSYGTSEDEQKQHLLRAFTSPLGTNGQFSYDAQGNNKRSDTTGAVDTLSAITRSTASYQHDDNYIHTQTDARGKTVTTEVDPDLGITTKVTDPKGQAVTYTHDILRRVTAVTTEADNKSYRSNYTYDQNRGLLTSVKHNVDDDATNDVVYNFEYDALGRKTKVLVGDAMLSENIYQNDPSANNFGTLTRMNYGNKYYARNVYDDFNRIQEVYYGNEETENMAAADELRYKYAYNANGQIAHVENTLLQHVTESEYDLSNRPSRVKTHKITKDDAGNITSEHIYTSEVAYDNTFGRLTEFSEKVGTTRTAYTTTFGYDEENRLTSLEYGNHGESTMEYDGLGRVAKTTIKAGSGTQNSTTYTYVDGAVLETEAPDDADDERKEAAANAAGKTSTTGLVQSITQVGGNFTYTYDDNGNIASVVQDGKTTAYTYDALGQLVRVDDEQENATWVYTYDQGGNILSKKKYALGVTSGTATESKVFTYGNANWRDQLTAVNGVGITYDAIGNPLNDGTWQYEWVNGRQLARIYNVDTDASFVYNENGLRVQKTVNGVVTKYTLNGKHIAHMTRGNDELHFFYDVQNKPAIVVYNGVPYSYVKNLQGDVVALLDSTGAVVVSYVYDAWGRPISKTGTLANTLGTVQPFRYRGYVYDEETAFYYLRSRYYNTCICRFTNSDILISGNLFAYSSNSATTRTDTDGMDSMRITEQDIENLHAFGKAYSNETGKGLVIELYPLSTHSIKYTQKKVTKRSLYATTKIPIEYISEFSGEVSMALSGPAAFAFQCAGYSVVPDQVEEALGMAIELTSIAMDLFDEYVVNSIMPSLNEEHEHTMHTLKIDWDNIYKYSTVCYFEVCNTGECEFTDLQGYTTKRIWNID